jgi:chorismate--pyruvate lyase
MIGLNTHDALLLSQRIWAPGQCHHWNDHTRSRQARLPHQWQSWLTDRGSLTQHLVLASDGRFEVKLLDLRWGYPTVDEARLLSIPARQKALIRTVSLEGCEQSWVVARTIIPVTTLIGSERQLYGIGQRSLGSVLFKDRTMRRGPLQTARLKEREHTLWARRSVFCLSGKPLLVAEVFLPPLEQVDYQPHRF